MKDFAVRTIITALALWVAVSFVDGIHWTGEPIALVGVALVFGLVNGILKPILAVLTCPLIVLSLGLFTLVINALLLMATASVSQRLGLGFAVDGFWPAFWGGLVIGLASTVLTAVMGKDDRNGDR